MNQIKNKDKLGDDMNNFKIVLDKNFNKKLNSFVVEISALLGFNSVAMEFPIVELKENIEGNICNHIRKDSCINSEDKKFIYIKEANINDKSSINCEKNTIEISVGNDEKELIKKLAQDFKEIFKIKKDDRRITREELDFSTEELDKIRYENKISLYENIRKEGLESLFKNGYLNKDEDNDLLPDEIDIKLIVNDTLKKEEIVALSNIAARLAMDVTAYSYPITIESDDSINNIFLVKGTDKEEEKGLKLDGNKRTKIYLCESLDKLIPFSSYICEEYNNIDFDKSFSIDLNKEKKIEEVKNNISENALNISKTNQKIHEKEYKLQWEGDEIKSIFEKEFIPQIKKGDLVRIEAALSENIEVREELKIQLKNILSQAGGEIESFNLYCAYKQGYSWLDEKIVKKITDNTSTKISKIDIEFKAFLPKGETQWLDESGAMPTYNISSKDTPNKWFDLPLRYLQELYPIDDILSEKLNMSRDDIKFLLYKGEEDITYRVTVYNDKGDIVLQEGYKAENSERSYLDSYPNLGLVHPCTGYIKIYKNDELIINKNIKTDLENIWEIYQGDILPFCKNFILEKTGGVPSTSLQPFFSQLRLDIGVSEPNIKLNVREDLISSIDAFHEDIYFVGSDFFKQLGQNITGEILDAPGLILPIIKEKDGAPYLKFTLYDVEKNNEDLKENKNQENQEKEDTVKVKSIKMDEMKIGGEITLIANNRIELVKYNQEIKESLENKFVGSTKPDKNTEYKKNRKIDIADIDIYENSVIGYKEYLEIIEQLKQVEELIVKTIGVSYGNREIHSIEFKPKYRGYVSRNKLINNRPVFFINCRHHANELSSTNTAFMLVREILKNEKYKNLTEELNLVIIPFENADGAAIHYELQKDNPNWILHIARFNSLGKEFAAEYHKDDTIHTEAKAFTKVWREWLPDVITDNHGVPSHEWSQQFSGYTSPVFKGFWLPRSLIYGYFWWLKDEMFKGNEKLSKKMESIVAKSINAHEEIRVLNTDWRNRFEKYANSWLPNLFPADYFENLIMYWIPFQFDFNHKYTNIKYPWITSVLFTSEVADETAQGDYLNLCARTHFYHNIATIDMLATTKLCYDNEVINSENGIKIRDIRVRPIL